MKRTRFRALSLLLCLCMVLGMLPVVSLAADEEEPLYLSLDTPDGLTYETTPRILFLYKVDVTNPEAADASSRVNRVTDPAGLSDDEYYAITDGSHTLVYQENEYRQMGGREDAPDLTDLEGGDKTSRETLGDFFLPGSRDTYANKSALFIIKKGADNTYTIQSCAGNKPWLTAVYSGTGLGFSDYKGSAGTIYITKSTRDVVGLYLTFHAPGSDASSEFQGDPTYIYFMSSVGVTIGTLSNGGAREVMYLYELDSNATPTEGNNGNQNSAVTQINSLSDIREDRYYMIVGNGNTKIGSTKTSVAVMIANTHQLARLDAGSPRTTVGNIISGNATVDIYRSDLALFKITKNSGDQTYTIATARDDNYTLTSSTSGASLYFQNGTSTPVFITESAADENGFYFTFDAPGGDPEPDPPEVVKYLDINSGGEWKVSESAHPIYFFEVDTSSGTFSDETTAKRVNAVESGKTYAIAIDGATQRLLYNSGTGTLADRLILLGDAATMTVTKLSDLTADTRYTNFLFDVTGTTNGSYTIQRYNTSARQLILGDSPTFDANGSSLYITPSIRYENGFYITVNGPGADPYISISEMFSTALDNTWVITGGTTVAGGVEQTGSQRNYVGHFEEYVRYTKGGDNVGCQRYVVNTGKVGQSLNDILTNFDERVANYNPRAVVYLVSREDFLGDPDPKKIDKFKDDLTQFIHECLALRNNNAFMVVQMPVAGSESLDYNQAVHMVVEHTFREQFPEEYSRIVTVDHHINEEYFNAAGLLNAAGHLEVARQLAQAIDSNPNITDKFPYGSGYHLNAETVKAPSTYGGTAPKVEHEDGTLTITTSESGDWTYTLTLSNDVVISGSATGSDPVAIPGVPDGVTYRLTVLTNDGANQLPTVSTMESSYTDAQQALRAMLSSKGGEQVTWLFMGDSITHGAAWTLGHDSVSQVFEKYLHDPKGMDRPQDVVVNTAVSGATVAVNSGTNPDKSTIANIQYRLKNYAGKNENEEEYAPDVVSIMLGTNDIAVSNVSDRPDAATFKQHLAGLINEITTVNPEAFIILRAPTYCFARPDAGSTYGDVMEQLAKEDDTNHTIYIDQYTDVAAAAKNYGWVTALPLFYGDAGGMNVHPGPLGHLIMARQFIRELGLWKWDNAIANLDYVLPINDTQDSTDVSGHITTNAADGSITLDISSLDDAYSGGDLGHTTLTAVNKTSNISYEITVPYASANPALSGLPMGEYTVTVHSVLSSPLGDSVPNASTAKSVTFASVEVSLQSGETGIESITVKEKEAVRDWENDSIWTVELPLDSTLPAADENDIVVKTTDPDATVEISDGENEGDGVYTITVTAKDGSNKTYTLTVTIAKHEHDWGDVRFYWRDETDWIDRGYEYYLDNLDAVTGATRTCTENDGASQTATVDKETVLVDRDASSAPTCEAEGKLVITSFVATFPGDETYTSEPPHTFTFLATGHDLKAVPGKAPTCTEAGNMAYYECQTCHKFFEDQEGKTPIEDVSIAATGHDETLAHVPEKTPTCTEGGNIEYWVCRSCSTFFADADGKQTTTAGAVSRSAEGHKIQEVAEKQATCTEPGNRAYYECSVCREFFTNPQGNQTIEDKESVKTSPKGHDQVLVYVPGEAATCEADGIMEHYKCDSCGALFEDAGAQTPIENPAIEALGHHLVVVPAKASTTTVKGNIEHYKCSRCDALFLDALGEDPTSEAEVELALANHDGHEWTVFTFHWTENGDDTTATLVGSGCPNSTTVDACDQQESVEAIVTEKPNSRVDPTCTDQGSVVFIATATIPGYGEKTGESPIVTLDATGHDLELVEGNAPTCTAPGNEPYYKCKNDCGKFFEDDAGTTETTPEANVIAPIAHDTEEVPAVTATCATPGNLKHYKCKVCGKLFDAATGGQELTEEDVTIPVTNDHVTVKVEAKEATTSETGLKEHWKCLICERLFEDKEGTRETNLAAVTTPKKEAPAYDPGPAAGTGTGTGSGNTNRTETKTSSEGVVGSTTKDASGNITDVGVTVPKAAADSGGVLTAPVEVTASASSSGAPEIDITVQGGGSAKVEIPVVNPGPGVVAVVVDENGNETILRDCIITEDGVALTVDGSATVKIVDNSKIFADIDTVPWARDAIIFTAAREIFQGTGGGSFDPFVNTDRGMMVTLLYRLEYEPDLGYPDFADVTNDKWYAQAVAWGQSSGVVEGYSADSFGPQDPVTREQLAMMLYRYASMQGMDTTVRRNLSAFTDGSATSGWATDAMEWAVGIGLIQGDDTGRLNAGDYATRAQIAVILQRFCQMRFA